MLEAEVIAKILVVDDLPENLLAMRAILAGEGREIVTVGSGREALRHLLEEDFAVILLDVNMPDMDGFETATLIRQRPKSQHTPIIFLTAHGDEARAMQGYSVGAVDYIMTPVVPEILKAKVGVFVELLRKTEEIRWHAKQRVILEREQAARTAAERAMQRLRLLADASQVLSGSLDSGSKLGELVRLLVPAWGDLGAVVVTDDASQPRQMEWAWINPEDGHLVRRSVLGTERQALIWDSIQRAIATGESVLLPARPTDEAEGVRDGHKSAMIVPLRIGNRTLGAICMAMGFSGRTYGQAEVALGGELAGRAAIAMENIRLYQEIQERDKRKDEFLALLAHELRNPLAPIHNAVNILRTQKSKNQVVQKASEMIGRQVNAMVRLVDDLLDVSRITRGKITLRRSPVEIRGVIEAALETSRPLIEARRHQLTTVIPPGDIWLDADASRLAQVVSNLLNNAAKFTDRAGRIWLTVESEGDEVTIRVRDTGLGISSEMLPRLFTAFTQADSRMERTQDGLGIGLTLVRGIVDLHGGTVTCHSEGLGHGSEFVVRLPKTEPGHEASAPGEHEAPARDNGWAKQRILIVDDNRDGAETLRMLLQEMGHEIKVVNDGPSALDAAREFRPGVILLDIGLPRMDGYEVAARLRALPETKECLLVAVTGYGREQDRERGRSAGFDHHMIKPVDIHALQNLFTQRLEH